MQAYSIDLRKKVISFIEEGNSQLLATKLFKLNKATVNRWWLRYKTEGHVNPRKNLGSKPRIDSLLITHLTHGKRLICINFAIPSLRPDLL